MNQDKTKILQTTVEWQKKLTPLMEKQIIKTHLDSFLDLYQNCTEEKLGLKPGKTKEIWLTEMIKEEIEEIKKGNILLATANIETSIENNMVGFITCKPVSHRHEGSSLHQMIHDWSQNQPVDTSKWQDSIRKDVYISLLAVKPVRNPHANNEKIQIGIGKQLVESAEAKFDNANALTLDTRLINEPGIAFYKRLGFSVTGERTFAGSDPHYYTGCEKKLSG